MDDNPIKTRDLCERCKFGKCGKACTYSDDEPCPLCSVFGCRCGFVQQNTPCPYFKEADVENSAKEFFQQIRHIDRQIDAKFEQLERLKALATKVTATMSEDSSRPSGVSRTMENTMDKIINLQNELNAEVDKLVDMKREANDIMRHMQNEKQRRCLEYRYLLGKTFEAISIELGYSYFGVCKLHGKALQSAEEIMKKSAEISES